MKGIKSALMPRQHLLRPRLVSTFKKYRSGERASGASVFAYHITDFERYGLVELDGAMPVMSIEEKAANPNLF